MESLRQLVRHPKGIGLVLTPFYSQHEEVTRPALEDAFEWFERLNGFSLIDHYSKQWRTYYTIFGGQIRLRSADDPDKMRGAEYSWAWLDEVSMMAGQDGIWDVLLGRMSATPNWRIWITTTPRGSHGIVARVLESIAENDPDYWESVYSSMANKLLDPVYFRHMKDKYSEDWWRQEVLAQMIEGGGTVYGQIFARPTHGTHFDLKRELSRDPTGRRWKLYSAIDWGDHYNHLLTFAYDSYNDQDILCDEYVYDHPGSVAHAVEAFAKRILSYGRYPKSIYTDPTGKKWNIGLKNRLKDKVPVFYLRTHKYRDIAFGVELVKRRLRAASGRKRLFVAKSVIDSKDNRIGTRGRGIVNSLEKYRYEQTRDGMAYRDKYRDDNWHTHAVDTLRYYIINRYRRDLGFENVVTH
jgi:hypothetical protein